MSTSDICIQRLNRVFKEDNTYGEYSYKYILDKLHVYNLSIQNSTRLETFKVSGYTAETVMIISLLEDYYNLFIQNNNSGDYIQLSKVLLLRGYIHDIKAFILLVRNGLELQALHLGRSILERELVLALYLTDNEYRKELVLNEKNKSDDERFYKLMRPKALLKRLKQNDNAFFQIFYSETWRDAYSLFSSLCHNNVKEWLGYYNEGNKFRITLDDSISPYIAYRCSYLNQNIIVFSMALLVHFEKDDDVIRKKAEDIVSFLLSYWEEIIKDSYK